jgi:hypothetical protein
VKNRENLQTSLMDGPLESVQDLDVRLRIQTRLQRFSYLLVKLSTELTKIGLFFIK